MLNQLLYAGPPLRVLHEEYAKNARIDDEDVALSGTHEGRHLMRGFITRPRAPRGPSLAGDLPEPVPAPGECIVGVRAFAINYGEQVLIKQRPDGWHPGHER
ncbi:MAG TPA: hypothetical protein VGA04_25300 [Streptosporangiaceae bacterium]